MEAIRHIFRNYAIAWETGNADLWLSIWDEEGIQMPPGGPALNKDALRRILPPLFVKDMVAAMIIEPEEIKVMGDFAFSRCRYTCDYTKEYAQPQEIGKAFSILKRQTDGSWKLYIDCHNSSIDPSNGA